jgi:serine/threonine protein phosphatase PrpC
MGARGGTNAHANARGSGEIGGGAAAATAYARGNQANASASCAGAPNCVAEFFARAEASDQTITPATYVEEGKRWNAYGWGTCSGSSSSGGKCGVTAWAHAGLGGGGGADCWGDCAEFRSGGDNWYTVIAPKLAPPSGYTVDKNGNLVRAPLDPNQRNVKGFCVGKILCVVTARGADGKTEADACFSIFCSDMTVSTPSGETITYDRGEHHEFIGSVPTEVGGTARDVGLGTGGVTVARDINGRGEITVTGTGQAYDGKTGSYTVFNQASAPGKPHRVHLGDKTGAPFATACSGCWGALSNGRQTDVFVVEAAKANAQLIARDMADNPAEITWGNAVVEINGHEGWTVRSDGNGVVPPPDAVSAGQPFGRIVSPSAGDPHGYFTVVGQTGSITLPNGLRMENQADGTPSLDERVTGALPDADGYGGFLECRGMCKESIPGNAPALPEACGKLCQLHDDDPTNNDRVCTARCTMRDQFANPNDPKTPNGYFYAHMLEEGGVGSLTVEGDKQWCHGKGCWYVVFNRDADGNGGGAICNAGGPGGMCSGANREGVFAQDSSYVDKETGEPWIGGTRILYHDVDPETGEHTHVGVSCSGGVYCSRSSTNFYGWTEEEWKTGDLDDTDFYDWKGHPDASWLPAVDANSEVPVFGPGSYLRPSMYNEHDEKLATDLGLNPKDPDLMLPPLSPAERNALSPVERDRYDKLAPQVSHVDLALASMHFIEDQSEDRHITLHAQRAGGHVDATTQLAHDIEVASQDGLTDQEVAAFQPRLGSLETTARDWAAARGLINTIEGLTWTQPIPLPTEEEIARDPEVAGKLADLFEQDPRARAENPGVVEQAQANVNKALGMLGSGGPSIMAALYLQAQYNDLEHQRVMHDAEVKEVMARGGTETKEEANQINARGDKILADLARVKKLMGPAQENRAAVQDLMRGIDQIFADGTDDTDWSGRVAASDALIDQIDGLAAKLRASGDPNQIALAGDIADTPDGPGVLSTIAAMNYEAITRSDGQRAAGVGFTLRLPSSGFPDVTFAQEAAINLPGYLNYSGEGRGSIDQRSHAEQVALASQMTVTEFLDMVDRPRTLDTGISRDQLKDDFTDADGDIDQAELDKAFTTINDAIEAGREVLAVNAVMTDDGEAVGNTTIYIVQTPEGVKWVKGGVWASIDELQHENELYDGDMHLVFVENALEVEPVRRNADGTFSYKPGGPALDYGTFDAHRTSGTEKAVDIGGQVLMAAATVYLTVQTAGAAAPLAGSLWAARGAATGLTIARAASAARTTGFLATTVPRGITYSQAAVRGTGLYFGGRAAWEIGERAHYGKDINPLTSAETRGHLLDIVTVGLAEAAGPVARLGARAGSETGYRAAQGFAGLMHHGSNYFDTASWLDSGATLGTNWSDLDWEDRITGLLGFGFEGVQLRQEAAIDRNFRSAPPGSALNPMYGPTRPWVPREAPGATDGATIDRIRDFVDGLRLSKYESVTVKDVARRLGLPAADVEAALTADRDGPYGTVTAPRATRGGAQLPTWSPHIVRRPASAVAPGARPGAPSADGDPSADSQADQLPFTPDNGGYTEVTVDGVDLLVPHDYFAAEGVDGRVASEETPTVDPNITRFAPAVDDPRAGPGSEIVLRDGVPAPGEPSPAERPVAGGAQAPVFVADAGSARSPPGDGSADGASIEAARPSDMSLRERARQVLVQRQRDGSGRPVPAVVDDAFLEEVGLGGDVPALAREELRAALAGDPAFEVWTYRGMVIVRWADPVTRSFQGNARGGSRADGRGEQPAEIVAAGGGVVGALPLHPLGELTFVGRLGEDDEYGDPDEMYLDEEGNEIAPVEDRSKVIKVRGGDGREYVVKHVDPTVLVQAQAAANTYAAMGQPVPRTALAVAVREVVDDAGEPVINVGDVVQVSEYVDGDEPTRAELSNGPLHDQLAGRFAVTGLLRDLDGVESHNLVADSGSATQIDFDTAFAPAREPMGYFVDLIESTRIFRWMTAQDVLAQFENVLRHRDVIIGMQPNDDLRRMVREGLDVMAEAVADGRVPDELANAMQTAHARGMRELGADPRPQHGYPSSGPLEQIDLLPLPPGERQLVGRDDLGRIAASGGEVFLHRYDADSDRWEITLRVPRHDEDAAGGATAPLVGDDPGHVAAGTGGPLGPTGERSSVTSRPTNWGDVPFDGATPARAEAPDLPGNQAGRRSGTSLAIVPAGMAFGADGVPAFVEGIAQLGLAGLAAAAVVLAVVRLVQVVRARGPPLARLVLSRIAQTALSRPRVRRDSPRLRVRLGVTAAGTALAGGLLAGALGWLGVAGATPIEPGHGYAAVESVRSENGVDDGATAPAAGRGDSAVVRVVPGDTVSGFTRRYGLSGYDRVTSDDPVRAAEIRANPDLIFAGELLRILLPPAPQDPGPGVEPAPVPPRGGHVSPDGGYGAASVDITSPVDQGPRPPAYVLITISVVRNVLGVALAALAGFGLWQRLAARFSPRWHQGVSTWPVELHVWLAWGRAWVGAAQTWPAGFGGAVRFWAATVTSSMHRWTTPWPIEVHLWLAWGRSWARAPLVWLGRMSSRTATFLRQLDPSGEGRFYPTGLQPLLGPFGDWVFQLLHVKLGLKNKVPGPKERPSFRERVRGLWQLLKSKVWNRAATIGPQFRESFFAQVPLPRWWDELFELWVGGSGGNYGVLSVLDQADNLNFRTKMRNRVVGLFPLIRLEAVLVVARAFALRAGFVHFQVPGKKLERKVQAPAVVGFHPVRRLVNWLAGHDWALVTWQVFSYISQFHFLIGVGPPDPDLPSWGELRFAPLKLDVVRDGEVVRTINLIAVPARVLRAVVLALSRAIGRILPASIMRRLAVVPERVRTRQARTELKIKQRGLTRIYADLRRKQDLLREVEKALEQLRDAEISRGTLRPLPRDVRFFTFSGEAVHVGDLLAARRARLEALYLTLIDAIRADHQSIRAIRESLTLLWDADASAVQGGRRHATGSHTRVPGVLGAITEHGGPGANGDSGWAAASQERVVAVIADEQGSFGSAAPASAAAVGAARETATMQLPSTTGERLARALYDSAAEATTPAADALDARSTSMLGAVVTRTGSGTEIVLVGVGDSRAYLVRRDGAELLTIDDSMATEESAEGPIRSDPRSASTRWLGARPAPEPNVMKRKVRGPALLVLVTDGVSDHFATPADLAAAIDVASGLRDPYRAARQVVDAAASAGGADDRTVVVVAINGPAGASERKARGRAPRGTTRGSGLRTAPASVFAALLAIVPALAVALGGIGPAILVVLGVVGALVMPGLTAVLLGRAWKSLRARAVRASDGGRRAGSGPNGSDADTRPRRDGVAVTGVDRVADVGSSRATDVRHDARPRSPPGLVVRLLVRLGAVAALTTLIGVRRMLPGSGKGVWGRLQPTGLTAQLDNDFLPAGRAGRSPSWHLAGAAGLAIGIAGSVAAPVMAPVAGAAALLWASAIAGAFGSRWQWVAVGVAGVLVAAIGPVALVVAFPAWAVVASNAAFALRGALSLLRPRPGPLGALLAAPLIGTFVVGLLVLVPAAMTGPWLDRLISGLYAGTVAAFGLSAVNAAYNLARNRDEPVHRLVHGLVTWVAYPITSNVGNVLLAIKFGWVAFDPVLLAVTVVLAVTFANASVLGIMAAVRPRRFPESYLQAMGAAGSVSLLYWGLLAIWPGRWAELTAAGVVAASVWGVSRIAAWRARLIHSPPGNPSWTRVLINVGVPGLFAAWLGVGLLTGLDLGRPATITAVAAYATVVALWMIHRLLSANPAPRSPAQAPLAHHVWTRGPPWARTVIKVVVVAAVAAAILASGGSAAAADARGLTPMGPVPTALAWTALGLVGVVLLTATVVAVLAAVVSRVAARSRAGTTILDRGRDLLDRRTARALLVELTAVIESADGLNSQERAGVLAVLRRAELDRHVLASVVAVLMGPEQSELGDGWALRNSLWAAVTRPDDYPAELARALQQIRERARQVLLDQVPGNLRGVVTTAEADSPQLAYLFGAIPPRYRRGHVGVTSRREELLNSEIARTIADARAELRAGNPAAADELLAGAERAATVGFGSTEALTPAYEALREVRAEVALLRFVIALRRAGLSESSFAIIGGLAVRARTGAPRRPKDVDIAVLLEPADRWRLVHALEAAGFVVVSTVTGRFHPGPDGMELEEIDGPDPTKPLTGAGFRTSDSDGRRPVTFDVAFGELGIEGLLVRSGATVEGAVVAAPVASVPALVVSKLLSSRQEDLRDVDDLLRAATRGELAVVRSVVRRAISLGDDWRDAISAAPTIAESVRAPRWWQRVLDGHRLWAGVVLLGLVVVAVVAGVDAAAGVAGILGFRVIRGRDDSVSSAAVASDDTGSTHDGGPGPAAIEPDRDPTAARDMTGTAEPRAARPGVQGTASRARGPPPGRGPSSAIRADQAQPPALTRIPGTSVPGISPDRQRGAVPPAPSWPIADGHPSTGGNKWVNRARSPSGRSSRRPGKLHLARTDLSTPERATRSTANSPDATRPFPITAGTKGRSATAAGSTADVRGRSAAAPGRTVTTDSRTTHGRSWARALIAIDLPVIVAAVLTVLRGSVAGKGLHTHPATVTLAGRLLRWAARAVAVLAMAAGVMILATVPAEAVVQDDGGGAATVAMGMVLATSVALGVVLFTRRFGPAVRALVITLTTVALLAQPAAAPAPRRDGAGSPWVVVTGADALWERMAWAGVGLSVVGLVVFARWALRHRRWGEQLRGWNGVGVAAAPAAGTAPAASHVLQRVLQVLAVGPDRSGVRLRDLRAAGVAQSDGPELARLSVYLAGLQEHVVERLIGELVAADLMVVERRAGEEVLVVAGRFGRLWHRAPPELRTAMARDLSTVLGDGGLAERNAMELAEAVRAVLRNAIWDRAAIRPGMRSLPIWLRPATRADLRKIFGDVSEVSRTIDRLGSDLRTAQRRLAPAERLLQRLTAAGLDRDRALRALWAAELDVHRAPTHDRRNAFEAARRKYQDAERVLDRVLRRMPTSMREMARYRAQLELEGRVADLRKEVADLRRRVENGQAAEKAAVLDATDEAVLNGFGRKNTTAVRDAAVLRWARFIAPLAGAVGAFPGQAAGAPMIASTEFAEYYGRSPSWVTSEWAQGTAWASGAGLGAALFGDRLIKNMVVVVIFGAAGSAALLVLGLVAAAAVFLPSVFVVGSMGIAGGLVRGRMDRHHPVALELKDARDASYETWFKATQFLLPVLIGQGMAVLGFQVTMLGLAVTGAVLVVAVWLALRGEGRDAMPRAPPAVWASITGWWRQLVGTPRGVARAVLSIPLLTALTGLYATALGGGMVDQLVLVNDPVQALGTTADLVSALVVARGLATMLTGRTWTALKVLLGSPGAVGKALGLRVQREPVREARVLVGVTLLPIALGVPAVWMALVPGLWPFAVMLTMGAVLTAWARMPLNRWVEGATGASLNNTAKAATIALGGTISATLLGDYSQLIGDRVAADLPYADLVGSANLTLAVLVVPVVVVPAVLAILTAKLRIGTLDELRKELENGGLGQGEAAWIAAKLAARGVNDVGTAAALFLHDDWIPRWARRWRLAERAARRASVGLTTDERAALIAALENCIRRDPPKT